MHLKISRRNFSQPILYVRREKLISLDTNFICVLRESFIFQNIYSLTKNPFSTNFIRESRKFDLSHAFIYALREGFIF